MMTVKGHVENGAVVLDEPMDLPDGAQVELSVGSLEHSETVVGENLEAGSLMNLIERCVIHTGIPDLSVRHDEYRFRLQRHTEE